jgi:hypothetical protein
MGHVARVVPFQSGTQIASVTGVEVLPSMLRKM